MQRGNVTKKLSKKNSSKDNSFKNKSESGRKTKKLLSPSKVSHRLQLAREMPVAEDPKLVKFLYYKSVLISSGADPEEILRLDIMINKLKNEQSLGSQSLNNLTPEEQVSEGVASLSLATSYYDRNEVKVLVENIEQSNDKEATNSLNSSIEGAAGLGSSINFFRKFGDDPAFQFRKLREPKPFKSSYSSENNSFETKSKKNASSVKDTVTYRPTGADLKLGLELQNSNSQVDINAEMNLLTKKMKNFEISPLNEKNLANIFVKEKF